MSKSGTRRSAHPPLEVVVSGEFACFTRPELKVERVSYLMPTPSAARGILEAIFWKPEFAWSITEIALLAPIRHFSITRNEVQGKASDPDTPIDADADRVQRHTLGLRDVAYLIRAQARPNSTSGEPEAKYRDQFRRRVERGQCFTTPYLGCREFSADFTPPTGKEQPEPISMSLGPMLWGMDWADPSRPRPLFFDAELSNGVMQVPAQPVPGRRR